MNEQRRRYWAKFLQNIDRQPYTIQVCYKDKHSYGSTTGGCITLIFYLLFAGFAVYNLINLFTQKQLIFQQLQTNNDFSNITLYRENFGLNITGNDGTNYFPITIHNAKDFGLRVMVQTVYSMNRITVNETEAVQGPNQFKQLFTFPQGYNLTVQGRTDIVLNQNENQQYRRVGMYVQLIDRQKFNLLKNITVRFNFKNNISDPKSQQFITGQIRTRIFAIRDGLPILDRQLQQLDLFFRKRIVITDTGLILPHRNKQVENFTHYSEQYTTLSTSNQGDPRNMLVWIKIKRSFITDEYNRHYERLPGCLSEIFGVGGLLYTIFIIYGGYNKWRFVNTELKQRKKKMQVNLLRFYWEQIAEILKIRKDRQVDQQLKTQFQKKLDIYTIMQNEMDFEQRISYMEETIQQICSKQKITRPRQSKSYIPRRGRQKDISEQRLTQSLLESSAMKNQ